MHGRKRFWQWLLSHIKQSAGKRIYQDVVTKSAANRERLTEPEFRICVSFRYTGGDLEVFEFKDADREWLWFIAQNRRPYLAKRLAGKVNPKAFRADVVIGKVANDKTNPTITAYLNGLYGDVLSERAVSFAIEELLPNQLEDQYCFRTENAVACLSFQEARRYVI